MSVERSTVEQRKGMPLASGVLDYFPDALLAVAEVSRVGNEQHHPGQPLHWDKSKSTDEADALMRHLLDRGTVDTDGMRHSAKVAWRALALLQRELDAESEVVPATEQVMVTYPAPNTGQLVCYQCGCSIGSPLDHSLDCLLYGDAFAQVADLVPHEVVSEEWGSGDGNMFALDRIGEYYIGTPFLEPDGCWNYRGKHVHHTVAGPDVYRDIDRDMANGS